MWDLVPRAGIEPRPPALGTQSLSHWITREVPRGVFLNEISWSILIFCSLNQKYVFRSTMVHSQVCLLLGFCYKCVQSKIFNHIFLDSIKVLITVGCRFSSGILRKSFLWSSTVSFCVCVIFIYLFYFWLCWVFLAVQSFYLVAESGGYSLFAVHRFLVAVAFLVAKHRV